MQRWLASVLAVFGLGCAPKFADTTTSGVPNLVEFAPNSLRLKDPWGYVNTHIPVVFRTCDPRRRFPV